MPSTKRMKTILKILGCFVLMTTILWNCSEKKENYSSTVPNEAMALSNTDQYVWEKMAEAFQPKTSEPLNMQWEYWASAEYTYADACGPREWPEAYIEGLLSNPKSTALVDAVNNQRISPNSNFETTAFTLLTLNFDNPYYEELRLNKAMFDYIQENSLFNQDSVYKMAKAGNINFPKDAMMIKAQWVPVDSSQVGNYYTKIISGKRTVVTEVQSTGEAPNIVESSVENQLMGLVGFHLVTHELPDWVWSTFEYSGNPGICDYIGCNDSYGNTETYIAPNPDGKVNQGYGTAGSTSEALSQLFQEKNVPDVFKNYRLKGSQIKYTTNGIDPIILGNSILEANLVSSSSCISCHARATLNNMSPRSNLGMFESSGANFIPPSQVTDSTTAGFHPVGYTGEPVVRDYLENRSYPDSTYYRTNFMWQLAQRATVCENQQ
jgi:hypothetical protein